MIYERLKSHFSELIRKHGLEDEQIKVSARPLSPEEAIGTPRDDDYPLLKGKERLMEAVFNKSRGHAYTDLYGNFEGTLREIASLKLVNNFKRAVFIASLNAVMRSLNLVEGTIHCHDEDPVECAAQLYGYLKRIGEFEKALLIGLQPRLLEALTQHYQVRAIDLDPDNIGAVKNGVLIESSEKVEGLLAWCDLALITGTTVVNGTIERFIALDKPAVFYGVTIAGPAKVLGLNHFCALGH